MKRLVLLSVVISLCFVAFTTVEAQQSKKRKTSTQTSKTPAKNQTVKPKTEDSAKTQTTQNVPTKTTEAKPAENALTFSGILLNKDGSPLDGKVVCLVIRDKDGKALLLWGLKEGMVVLANPNGKSDSQGRFTIKMERYLKNESDTDELEFGICEGSREHRLTKVKIDGNATKIDLGRLTIH